MHRVVVLALDRVIPFDLGIPFQVFGDACDADGRRLYEPVLAGPQRGPLLTAAGFTVAAPRGAGALRHADTVVVAGSQPPAQHVPREAVEALVAAHRRGARLISICTGAFVLAQAGLLDGRRATTHWAFADSFRARFPSVRLDPSVLYVDEGEVLTSAGASAGIDLCVHVVATDHGTAVANDVARRAVAAAHRSGGQAQYVVAPVPAPNAGSLEPTREWARSRIAERITIEDMAAHANVSRRTLIRRFRRETGASPLRWLNDQRALVARGLLEQGHLSIEQVARASGFGSAQALRLHFRRALGTTPQAYRASFAPRHDAARAS